MIRNKITTRKQRNMQKQQIHHKKTNQETKTKVYKQRKFKIKEICLKLCIT